MKVRPEYKILTDNAYRWMFVDSNSNGGAKYYSYRHYILNIFFNYIRKNTTISDNEFINDFQKELEILKNVLENQNYGVSEYKFFKYLKAPNESLIVYSEHSDLYPLFIKLDEITKQRYAFLRTINNILNHLKDIVTLLKKEVEWTHELQEHLDKSYYDYNNQQQ